MHPNAVHYRNAVKHIYPNRRDTSMPYHPNRHHRRSIRLRGYDYATPGTYFVTICAQNRLRLFGAIADGVMIRSQAGELISSIWESLPLRFPTVELDVFVVMPEHFHAIVALKEAGIDTMPLGNIIGAFKSLTTNVYIHGVRESGWPPFEQRLWQRNYYESIIRDADHLARVRNYILTNPARRAESVPSHSTGAKR
jgi:putative transposase